MGSLGSYGHYRVYSVNTASGNDQADYARPHHDSALTIWRLGMYFVLHMYTLNMNIHRKEVQPKQYRIHGSKVQSIRTANIDTVTNPMMLITYPVGYDVSTAAGTQVQTKA